MPCLHKELPAAGHALLTDMVAQSVASVPLAIEAMPLVECLHVLAPVACDLLIIVSQRVDKQMN